MYGIYLNTIWNFQVYFLDGEGILEVMVQYFSFLSPSTRGRFLQLFLLGGTSISTVICLRIFFLLLQWQSFHSHCLQPTFLVCCECFVLCHAIYTKWQIGYAVRLFSFWGKCRWLFKLLVWSFSRYYA